jgi:hypothetical protein
MNARDGSIAAVNEAKAAAHCLETNYTASIANLSKKKKHEQKPYHRQLSPLIEFEGSGSNRGATKIGRRYKPYSPLLHLCKTATTLLQTKAPSFKTQQGNCTRDGELPKHRFMNILGQICTMKRYYK